MKSARAWLFDLDGTLADTAPDLVAAANALRVARDMDPLPLTTLRGEASNGARGLIDKALGIGPEDASFPAARADFLQHYADNLHAQTRLFPRMQALLQSLEEQGTPWGIVTNKPIALARPLVKALQIKPAVLLGGDSGSQPKPDPGLLWLAAAHLRLNPAHCLYLGDAPRDIEAGNRAGMHTVACGWGYIETCPDPADWGADLYARAVDDLQALLP